MKRTIFYSWQSDLPNSTNRGFIESAIEKSIEQLKDTIQLSIELSLDKDTKETAGTPDIADTILGKIDRASLFIADISIVSSKETSRKTPNPNVLIELGYAAKSLGWDRVVCVYNKDFGDFADLPFDLRHRRPLGYSLKDNDKGIVKDELAKAITQNVSLLQSKGRLFNELQDYLKKQVDTEVLTLANWLDKIVHGYQDNPNVLISARNLLQLNSDTIRKLITDSEFIGFQVFKSFHVVEANLKVLLDKVLASQHYGAELVRSIAELYEWVGCFDAYTRTRSTPDLFMGVHGVVADFRVLAGEDLNPKDNKQLPDRHILLKKIDESPGRVTDFGDFSEKPKIEALLNKFKLNPKHVTNYCNHIFRFITIVDQWLELTNGEFVLDTFKQFDMKPVSNKGVEQTR